MRGTTLVAGSVRARPKIYGEDYKRAHIHPKVKCSNSLYRRFIDGEIIDQAKTEEIPGWGPLRRLLRSATLAALFVLFAVLTFISTLRWPLLRLVGNIVRLAGLLARFLSGLLTALSGSLILSLIRIV
jgi:hypothetical protein